MILIFCFVFLLLAISLVLACKFMKNKDSGRRNQSRRHDKGAADLEDGAYSKDLGSRGLKAKAGRTT